MSERAVLAEPILVGREKELEELQSFLNSAIEGKGKTVFISGEAGAGKTRLTKEFLSTAKKQGIAVLTGWCLSNAAVPYFPFFEAFGHFFRGEKTESAGASNFSNSQPALQELDLASWLTDLSQAQKWGLSQTFSPQVWKDQTFAAVSRILGSIAQNQTVILFLDDIQWADSASLALVHYLARSVSLERVLLIASFRSENLTVDTEGKPSSLIETLRLMRREELFEEIELLPLSQERVADLAKNMLGGDLQPDLAQKLSSESQGNPLFVVESLRMLSERDNLIIKQDKWGLKQYKLGLPDKIKDIILQRLSVLNRSQRKVLDAASVIGERFDAQILASALGIELAEVVEILDSIEKSTALVDSDAEFFRFDHARSREAVYSEIVPAMVKIYHTKIAEKLEETRKPGDLLATDLAYHYTKAGNKEKALRYALAAGQDALARWSNAEAIKHFEYVLKEANEDSKYLAEKLAALEGLGDAFFASNNFGRSITTFEALAEIQIDEPLLRTLRKAMFAAFYLGDISKLDELTLRAEQHATADRLEAGRVLHQKGRIFGMRGDALASLKLSESALRIFEEEYALSDAAWILFVVGTHSAGQGLLQRGVESDLRSIAIFNELGDVRSQMEASFYTGLTFLDCLLEEEGEFWFAKVVEIDEKFKLRDYIKLIPTYCFWSLLYFVANPQEARSKLLKALEYSEKVDSKLYLGLVYLTVIRQAAFDGDISTADHYYKKFEDLPQEVLVNTFTLGPLDLTMAIYFAAKNQFEKSEVYFHKNLERKKGAVRSPSFEFTAKAIHAWALAKQGREEEAKVEREAAEEIAKLTRARFAHVSIRASLMALTHPTVNEKFEIRLDLVNTSRSQGSLVKVEGLSIPEVTTVGLSSNCFERFGHIECKDNNINPFEVKTIKITAQATKPVSFILSPVITYVDDLGENKTTSPRTLTIDVQSLAVEKRLEGKIETGSENLDRLLIGGIPERYAVALVSPSSDERDNFVKEFLTTGLKQDQLTFQIATEMKASRDLLETFPSTMHLLLCKPKSAPAITDLPNVYSTQGVDNLTDIDIALTKALRRLDSSNLSSRRVCIEIISDVLLQYHAVTTRKWLSNLFAELKKQNFTILAIVDPTMHAPEEVNAILSLFDGEVHITKKETANGPVKTLKVSRLQGQSYLKDEVTLR